MKKPSLKSFSISISYLMIVIIFISAIINLYEKRGKLKNFINSKKEVPVEKTPEKIDKYLVSEEDNYWAKEIMNGGYILHFRHAVRDKWVDIQMYDVLESDVHNNGKDESRYAENDYFANAVCLNDRGKIQAKAIGESLNYIAFPIGVVYSSVSCRARQTAELAFGGYDKLYRILMYKGAYNEDDKNRVNKLIELYSNINIDKGKNAIISSHGKVISCEMFINDKCPESLSLGEGGFYILRQSEKGLLYEYKFHNFYEFNKVFYNR